MTEPTHDDPEWLFRRAILAQPGAALPRQLYADWCDENGRGAMAEVQRWFAATGRAPEDRQGHYFWRCTQVFLLGPGLERDLLPEPIFAQIPRDAPGLVRVTRTDELEFRSAVDAEEAVALAWERVTQAGGGTWRPSFPSAESHEGMSFELPPEDRTQSIRQLRQENRLDTVRTYLIVVVTLVFAPLMFCSPIFFVVGLLLVFALVMLYSLFEAVARRVGTLLNGPPPATAEPEPAAADEEGFRAQGDEPFRR